MTNKSGLMSNNLKENQTLAAQLLAAGKTGRAVAAEVGVTEETISRWRQEPEFQMYLTGLVIATNEAARIRLQSLITKAVANIENSLNDETLSTKDKFVASIKVLELCNGYNWVLEEKVKYDLHRPG